MTRSFQHIPGRRFLSNFVFPEAIIGVSYSGTVKLYTFFL